MAQPYIYVGNARERIGNEGEEGEEGKARMQRRVVVADIGVKQPLCTTETERNRKVDGWRRLGGWVPVGNSYDALTRLGFLPAMSLLVSFLLFSTALILCLVMPPQPASKIGDQTIPDTAACLRVARHSDSVTAEVNIGSPVRRYKLLLRFDEVLDASANTMRLFSDRVMESKTLTCESTVCTDTVLLSKGPTAGFSRAYTSFEYTNKLVEIYTPRDAAGGIALNLLGLDGEFRVKKSSKYWLTATHLCFASNAGNPTTTESTTDTLFANIESGNIVRTPAANLAKVSSAYLGSSYARKAAIDLLCDATGGVGNVDIFPVAAASEQRYLSLNDENLYEQEPAAVSRRRQLVEVGTACTRSVTEFAKDLGRYELDCDTAYASCRGLASLSFRRVAQNDFIAQYGTTTATFEFASSPSLSSLPRLSDVGDATAVAVLRLVLVLAAAALTWMRQNRVTSKPHFLYRHCIQTVHNCADLHEEIDDDSSTMIIEDALLGLFAVVAHFSLALWRANNLGVWDNQSRATTVQIVASVVSGIHFLLRWTVIEPSIVQILGGAKAEHGEGPLMRLGGSQAVVDASSAVLLSFAEPPLFVSVQSRFDGTARLLVGVLLGTISIPRCLFSVACVSLAFEASTLGRLKLTAEYSILLLASAFFWTFQLCATAVSLVDLVASPLAFSLLRGSVGGVGWTSAALALAFVVSGIPRMLSSTVKLGEKPKKN